MAKLFACDDVLTRIYKQAVWKLSPDITVLAVEHNA
jgi:hypothetical protein